MAFLFSLAFLLSGFAGPLLGGLWTFLPVFVVAVIIPLGDLCLPADKNRPSGLPAIWFDCVLYGYFILHIILLACIVGVIAWTDITLVEWIGLTVSSGVLFGSLGFTYAHEMIHRPSDWWRWRGETILVTLCYGQYAISHLQCHHRWVGTLKDPMTAREGQSLYSFWLQAIPGAIRFSWRTNRSRSVVYWTASLVLASVIWAFGGWPALAYFVAQAILAILILAGGDYIEHYGLTRRETSPGRFESFQAKHSWDSDHWFSGKILIHLQRHSDHHLHAARHFQDLVFHDEAPQLPASYASMIFLAMVPPLFKRALKEPLGRQRLSES